MNDEKQLVIAKSVSLYKRDWEKIRRVGKKIGANDSATIRFIVSQFADKFLIENSLVFEWREK